MIDLSASPKKGSGTSPARHVVRIEEGADLAACLVGARGLSGHSRAVDDQEQIETVEILVHRPGAPTGPRRRCRGGAAFCARMVGRLADMPIAVGPGRVDHEAVVSPSSRRRGGKIALGHRRARIAEADEEDAVCVMAGCFDMGPPRTRRRTTRCASSGSGFLRKAPSPILSLRRNFGFFSLGEDKTMTAFDNVSHFSCGSRQGIPARLAEWEKRARTGFWSRSRPGCGPAAFCRGHRRRLLPCADRATPLRVRGMLSRGHRRFDPALDFVPTSSPGGLR